MPVKGGKGGGGGGGASAKGIRDSGAFYELFVKDSISKVLDKVQGKVKAFSSFMKSVGGALMGGGAALGAGPLALLFGGGSRLADAARLSRQFQLPIELIGKFQQAAEKAGVSIEEVMNDTEGRFSDLVNGAGLIDPDQARAALQIESDFKDALHALQDAMTPLLSTISPIVTSISKFIQENAEGVRVVAKIAAGIFLLGTAFTTVGTLVGGLASAISFIVGLVASVFTPLGLLAAGIAGVGVYLASQLFDWGKAFDAFSGDATEAWGLIVEAIKSGDLELAFKVACATLQVAWANVVNEFTKIWVGFKEVFVDSVEDMRFSLAKLLGKAAEGLGLVEKDKAGRGGLAAFLEEDAKAGKKADAIARMKEIADAEAKLRAAEKERDAVLGEARAKLREFGGGGDFGPGPGFDADGKFGRMAAGFEAVKGGFNVSNAIGQFGYGNKTSPLTELMKQLVNGEGKLPDRIGMAVLNGMRVK